MTRSSLARVLSAAALAAATGCTPENGPSMRPGSDCLECHGNPGAEEDGPPWTVAGTVYATPGGTGEGVRGATVTVTDATGRTVTLRSQAVGNFYLADKLTFPLRASVERNGVRHDMPDRFDYGGCNGCHRPGGEAGGSIAAP